MVGKLPLNLMLKYVYPRVGRIDPSVIIGPSVGEDAAIIDLGDGRVLVAHNDAISGAIKSLGWLAVHIVSNDVAVRGARPRWFLMSLFLPKEDFESTIDEIMKQVDRAAKELDMMVIGGHTEITSGIDRPIIGTTAIGLARKDRYVTTSGARTGDYIIVTKGIGIEGTAIICTDFAGQLRVRGVDENIINSGARFLEMVSVVKEAMMLAENGFVTAMHDPTEAGILGGLAELAYASKKTVEAYEENMPIFRETSIVSSALNIDPLRLISSGTLVASAPPDKVSGALKALENEGIESRVIGRVREFNGNLVEIHRLDGRVEIVREAYFQNEIFRLWKKIGTEKTQ